MAEQVLVHSGHCIPVPDELDDVSAAAIANPGRSASTALVERAHFQSGETVLINGATGTAGRLAVQLAKRLGAMKILVSGRNAVELEQLRSLGADLIFPFQLGPDHPTGCKEFEQSISAEFPKGLDIVLDYLWGESAHAIIVAIAKSAREAYPVRFVQIGSAGGQENIELPAAALRSSAIQLMGSGLKSVPLSGLLVSVQHTFQAALPAQL